MRIPELEAITGIDRIFLLRKILNTLNLSWLKMILKKFDIKGRTKIYNSFKSIYTYSYFYLKEKERQKRGEERLKEQIRSCVKILNSSKWTDWIEAFCEEADTICIESIIASFTNVEEYHIITKVHRTQKQKDDREDEITELRKRIYEIENEGENLVIKEEILS